MLVSLLTAALTPGMWAVYECKFEFLFPQSLLDLHCLAAAWNGEEARFYSQKCPPFDSQVPRLLQQSARSFPASVSRRRRGSQVYFAYLYNEIERSARTLGQELILNDLILRVVFISLVAPKGRPG